MSGKFIFYGVAGEGLGHASRALAIIEHMPDVEFWVFTFGDAYDFFKNLALPNVLLTKIPGLRFGRHKDKVSNLGTIKNFLAFLPQAIAEIKNKLHLPRPNLVISDFEPIMPRLAHEMKVPCISIDNQHKFSRCDISDLPWGLRLYCFVSGRFVEAWVPRPRHAVIANLCPLALKQNRSDTTLANCFLRKYVTSQEVRDEDFLLIYWKKSIGKDFLKSLQYTGRRIKVYGAPLDIDLPYEFKPLDYRSFVEDLAHCSYVLGGAGNQLLGESVYFGKPVFAIPEPNQKEQSVNAFYIEKVNAGMSCPQEEVEIGKIREFLNKFKDHERKTVPNGVSTAIGIIQTYLR